MAPPNADPQRHTEVHAAQLAVLQQTSPPLNRTLNHVAAELGWDKKTGEDIGLSNGLLTKFMNAGGPKETLKVEGSAIQKWASQILDCASRNWNALPPPPPPPPPLLLPLPPPPHTHTAHYYYCITATATSVDVLRRVVPMARVCVVTLQVPRRDDQGSDVGGPDHFAGAHLLQARGPQTRKNRK